MSYSAWLRNVSQGKGRIDKRYGLCSNFYNQFDASLYNELTQYNISLEDWPHFSGSRDFPVKSGDPRYNVGEMYGVATNMYDEETPYGRHRRELAAWLADQFEKVNQ
jgi:hypothetical protein